MPWRSIFSLIILVGAFAGCGPGRGDVTGQITFQGRPVEVGTVTVLPSDKIIRNVVIEGGKYTLHNVPAGPAKFTVSSPDPLAQRVAARKEEERKRLEAEATARGDKWFPIPERYSKFDDSGLTYEVHAGSNEFDIKLTP
jgi:hypothetical protein